MAAPARPARIDVIAPRLDAAVVGHRLRSLGNTLDELEALRGADAERLRREPLQRAAAERLMQVVVDLAIDCNAHIAVAILGRAPENGRGSFIDAASVGAIEVELCERLAPAAGLHNVLYIATSRSESNSSHKRSTRCSTGSRSTFARSPPSSSDSAADPQRRRLAIWAATASKSAVSAAQMAE
jgi:uncharacterized protein YutE (UPF0331/DUF86 family)